MRHILLGTLILLCFAGCQRKQKSSVVEQEKEKEPKIYKSNPNVWRSADLDKSLLHDSLQALVGHQYPVRIFRDKNGQVVVSGWEDLVNFDVDPDCSDKFYYFEIPLDTAVKYSERSWDDSPVFSMNSEFKRSGKRFIKNEINHKNSEEGVIFNHSGVNLYYWGNQKDSLVVLSKSLRNPFNKKVEVTALVVNLGSRPVEQLKYNITLVETSGLKDTMVIQEYKYDSFNLLPEILPAQSMQMIRTILPGQMKTSTQTMRYYQDQWFPVSYRIQGESEDRKLK